VAMKVLQNVTIIVLIALAITVFPAGDAAATTVLTAITMAFLGGIGWFVYVAHRENPMMISSLSEGWRAIHWGSLGLIAFLIAGYNQLWETGAGTLLWIGLIVIIAIAAFLLMRRRKTEA